MSSGVFEQFALKRNPDSPLVVAYGGGTNSTAILTEFHFRGIVPDLILFADTGGEKPETYGYLGLIGEKLEAWGFPPIVPVTYAENSKHKSLEDACLTLKTLPSLAYGMKSCSLKWKRAPQDKYVNNWNRAKQAWAAGVPVTKVIGYDINEMRRAGNHDDDKYVYWHPLIEWGMDRGDCEASIVRAGIPVPMKSSCFFCPASRKNEIEWLQRTHPDLHARALKIEENAKDNLGTVAGLGRRYSWASLMVAGQPVCEAPEIACGCFDGGDEQ